MKAIPTRYRFVGTLALLLTLPSLTGADGNGCGGGIASPPAPGPDAATGCAPSDCAGLAAPSDAKLCSGGTAVGRTVCAKSAAGPCEWDFPACPVVGEDAGSCLCPGPAPSAPTPICPDGSTAGPVCMTAPDGTCGWQIRSCSTQVCPGLGCFPSCPNGILKDSQGCDTCQCAPAADAGGAGSTCTTDADCAAGSLCGFPIPDACAATGTCFVAPQVLCNAASPGCACDGSEVNIVCNGLPSGYAPAPLLHQGACTDSGPSGGAVDGGACCPTGWDLYSCTYPDGGAGSACHNPQLGCASSLTCGQGCDGVVTGRCAP
jgi:Antistasin family